MKIINDIQEECKKCGTKFIIEPSDERKYGELGNAYISCPRCGELIYLDEEPGLKITSENVKFPEHFFHFREKEGVKLSNAEIQEYVKVVMESMDKDKERYFSCAGTGNAMVIGLRWEDEVQIIVAQNYYDLSYDFEED